MRLDQAEQLLASSLTVAEWCRLNKVAESTMYLWLKRLREQKGSNAGRKGWIEVDRAASRERVALAKRSDDDSVRIQAASPSAAITVDVAEHTTLPSIRVSANGIGIEVPHGACESDITAVMRAAMTL